MYMFLNYFYIKPFGLQFGPRLSANLFWAANSPMYLCPGKKSGPPPPKKSTDQLYILAFPSANSSLPMSV